LTVVKGPRVIDAAASRSVKRQCGGVLSVQQPLRTVEADKRGRELDVDQQCAEFAVDDVVSTREVA